MIYKGSRQHISKVKMGANISKRKEKKEGLMNQMKNKTEPPSQSKKPVSPSPSLCQTPPPRNLATTLSSPALSQDFLAFLATLDTASCLEEGELGRRDTLGFVLELRALEEQDIREAKSHSLAKYFPVTGGGLVIENQMLWKECAEAVSSPALSVAGKARLAMAAEVCCQELEPLHVVFLSQRKERSPLCNVISCLL